MKTATTIALLLGLCFGAGCATNTPQDPVEAACGGKCDDAQAIPQYEADIAAMNANWSGTTPMQTVEDAYRVTVRLGDQTLVADTHLFGTDVNVIPYADGDNVADVDGNNVERGDAVIAQYFPPGEIGIAVKHHRPEHRELTLGGPGDDMKEHFKLQDTHIEIVVGVERDGQPGAITLNNPQDYQNGRFGNANYSMMFLRPVYPAFLTPDQITAFRDNIRTMLLGFNAVSNFPGDYNGGDPLAANSPEKVREHVGQMIRAIAGDADARAWFQDPANQVYCAELAHISFSAGMIVPLNAANIVPMVGQDTWDAYVAELEKHAAGQDSAFTDLNDNEYAALVDVTLAPEDLRPTADYAPVGNPAARQIAFQPMTMADIVESFMATHIPRDVMGEGVAPIQAAVLSQMKPGLLEAMAMDQIPETDPRRQAVDALFAQLVEVVGTSYGSYDEFRANLQPVMDQARMMTGPRDDTGTGLFVPPSLMHLIAKGRFDDGLMSLRYIGHGVHWSMVRGANAGPTTPTEPTTPAEPTTPTEPTDPEPTSNVIATESGSVGAGEQVYFTIETPAGASRLVFTMDSSQDADLYVRNGDEPTVENFDCRPYEGSGATEVCEFAPPAGTYQVMIRGYNASTFELTVKAE
ncbi:MAG: hypothetical protein DRJ42_02845 [Deltaproteobacteria bacterium]|nr:MAG: hypothetical protein DRJ42_02845 [Deltaproteobacteria bacterium]